MLKVRRKWPFHSLTTRAPAFVQGGTPGGST
ncbi:hypothetical protein SPHINGOAX6_40072 [Sphingomonas sp. AX6]|nr:hypothetical protein SPHINGOAX6_40072 [Sphingomonas sp. AX6]